MSTLNPPAQNTSLALKPVAFAAVVAAPVMVLALALLGTFSGAFLGIYAALSLAPAVAALRFAYLNTKVAVVPGFILAASAISSHIFTIGYLALR